MVLAMLTSYSVTRVLLTPALMSRKFFFGFFLGDLLGLVIGVVWLGLSTSKDVIDV